jgi:renal tumor antigen
MEFDFQPQQGSGLEKLMPANISPDVTEIISKLLTYDYTHRMSASQALKHPYFKDFRDADKLAEQS